jgi:pilus assembly protein Flp/PilA
MQPLPLTIPRKLLAARRRGRWRGQPDSGAQSLTKERAMRTLQRIIRCERGANAIEYALVASLIAIAAFAAFQNLGNRVDAMYNNVSNHL